MKADVGAGMARQSTSVSGLAAPFWLCLSTSIILCRSHGQLDIQAGRLCVPCSETQTESCERHGRSQTGQKHKTRQKDATTKKKRCHKDKKERGCGSASHCLQLTAPLSYLHLGYCFSMVLVQTFPQRRLRLNLRERKHNTQDTEPARA